jgi:hypothetical protein
MPAIARGNRSRNGSHITYFVTTQQTIKNRFLLTPLPGSQYDVMFAIMHLGPPTPPPKINFVSRSVQKSVFTHTISGFSVPYGTRYSGLTPPLIHRYSNIHFVPVECCRCQLIRTRRTSNNPNVSKRHVDDVKNIVGNYFRFSVAIFENGRRRTLLTAEQQLARTHRVDEVSTQNTPLFVVEPVVHEKSGRGPIQFLREKFDTSNEPPRP